MGLKQGRLIYVFLLDFSVGVRMKDIIENTHILINGWRYLMCKKATVIRQCGHNAFSDVPLASLNL
jgi:hypothetical protein